MICPNCGSDVGNGTRFCKKCGAELSVNTAPKAEDNARHINPTQNYPAAKKQMPAWAGLLIGLAVMAALLAGLWAGGIVSFGGRSSARAGADQEVAVIEGEGFESPEEAVCAYLEALKAGDLNQMFSTFAVETYCREYNTAAYYARIGAVMNPTISANPISPTDNPLIAERNIKRRQADLINTIDRQLLQMEASKATARSWSDLAETDSGNEDMDNAGFKTLISGLPVTISKETDQMSEAEKWTEALQDLPDLSKLEIGEILYAEALQPDTYLTAGNLNNLKRYANLIGAEGFKSLAVHFTVEEMQGILYMDTAKYQGRWYNITPQGNIAVLANRPTESGGMDIAYPDDVLVTALNEAENNLSEVRDWFQDLDFEEFRSDSSNYGELSQMTKEEIVEFFSLTELE